MTFQFLCPQGHLLEGEEAHMGQECQCPQCGTAFIIPSIEQQAGPVDIAPGSLEDIGPLDDPQVPQPRQRPAPQRAAPGAKPSSSKRPAPDIDFGEFGVSDLSKAAQVILHILCPNGHELETPREMLGRRAKCPECGAEFVLKREKSIEYLRELELLERKRARMWFQLSIAALCFIVFVVIAMILISVFS